VGLSIAVNLNFAVADQAAGRLIVVLR
jgi:hypothetical protein